MKICIPIVLFLLLIRTNSFSQTIHFISAFATKDPRIGSSANTVHNNWINECSKISQYTGLSLKSAIYSCNDRDFNKIRFEKVLNSIHPATNDVLFIYVFGHGYRSQGQVSRYPNVLMTSDGSVSKSNYEKDAISTLYITNLVKSKKARLTILIIEACNAEIAVNEPDKHKGFISPLTMDIKWSDEERYKELFVKSKGNIVFASASPNEKALISVPGAESHFAENFRIQFQNMVSQSDKADWNTLLKNATQYTRKNVWDIYQLKQEPFYEADVIETQTIVASTEIRTSDINANQQQYEFFMTEGVAFYRVRKVEQAILSFRSALKYKPNDQQAYNNIAVCQADLGIVVFTQADYSNFYRILSKLESQADFKLSLYAYSQYTLGIMYLKGKGCKKDHDKALYWLTVSASNGVQGACRVLNRLGIDNCN